MIKPIKILFPLLIVLAANLKAQEVIKRDTLNGTELTIEMDGNVSRTLIDAENVCSRASNTNSKNYENLPTSHVNIPKINVPNRPLSDAEICRQNPRILGYKIQLTVVKSNEEAQQVKAFFRNRFPNIKAETDASLRPNYKILAGSYFTKQSASGDLSKIKQYFKSAVAVQYRVFCVEAK